MSPIGGSACSAAVARRGRSSIAWPDPVQQLSIVVNRSPRRAQAAADLAGAIGVVGEARDVADCDIVVNATSVGMDSNEMPCDADLLHSGQIVADIVYHPRRTALLTAAERVGARTVEGLGMLVHQAVLQQQLWTGLSPDATVMWAAAERELASRPQ